MPQIISKNLFSITQMPVEDFLLLMDTSENTCNLVISGQPDEEP